ncbi:MAG: phosphocholine cytidylyltransferase family protein [Deltaproteobacteria bacterium]|nr:phosphocholine cytidylyltransferase family protein [Deltaproteobacteria bacterium]
MTVAVLLVAGVGSRLRPLTDRCPKCLLSLGRETLLGRALRVLEAAGVTHFVLSAGYLEGKVREAARGLLTPVTVVSNPDHARVQNVVSLARALRAAPPGELIKLDGDLVFSEGLARRILQGKGEARCLVDRQSPLGAEEMKVQAAPDGRIARFGKGLDPGACLGESIGFERFGAGPRGALTEALEHALERGQTALYYEEVYNDLVARGLSLEPVFTDGEPWTEVDTPEDLEGARRLVESLGEGEGPPADGLRRGRGL